MREIVYLSEGKLKQFLPEPRRAPRAGALRVTTPVGGFDVESPAADGDQSRLRHLELVSRHMEEVSRWYEEPDLRPGEWVQFEARLRSVTLPGAHRNLVLFVDPPPSGGAGHGGGCRLLLHGSVRHLRGWIPETADPLETEAVDNEASFGPSFVTRAGQVVRALDGPEDGPVGGEGAAEPVRRLSSRGIRELVAALDMENGDLDTAVPMTGYARVSVLVPESEDGPRCLVASPLTVQITRS
ncbi:SAVMC3_10250 family protein [Streptomyces sp. NPDC003327]